MKRDADAVDVALQLSRLYPSDAEVLYQTGRLFANYAYLTTMKLAEVAPDSVWLHQAAGEANESQGLFDAAIREYEVVAQRDPRRPGLQFRLGRALLSQARQASGAETGELRARALKHFQQELAIDATNANAAYEAGELQRQAGLLDEGRTLFEMAVAQDPEFEEALVGLGRTLVALGSAELALPHLLKATTINPQSEVAYYQLSLAHRALGNSAEQEKTLAEYRRLRLEKSQKQELLARPPAAVTQQEVEGKPVP
jgi:tetratricopeptide (TPR) repeat protein